MPRLRHTVEEILPKLRKAEVTLTKRQSVAQACRTLGITEQTYYPAAVPGRTELWRRLRGCSSRLFVQDLRAVQGTPHVAQPTTNRVSAIDGRTTRHPGYTVSQQKRKRVEEIFGWLKTVG